ncbi:MAG: M1 family metallopeptidase [Chloroflexi bacterium]|nr:M1 family metallopeptidase [Chloroflexota bacterium]
MKSLLPLLLALPLLMTGCTVAPISTSPPPTPTAVLSPVLPTATTLLPTPTPPPPTATPTPALPHSTLFDLSWDDRSLFQTGLIPDEQAALKLRPDASMYHISITLADDLTSLHGREEVHYTNTEDVPLPELDLRLFPNVGGGRSRVTQLLVNGEPVTPRYTLQDSVMIVPMQPPLLPGESVVLAMSFYVEIPTEPGGNYGTFALLDNILALAHFYPMIAVYDDEGWNVEIAPEMGDVVYADTSYYLVRVTAPASQTLVASGVAVEKEKIGDQQVVTFAAGPMRDFYLVSSDRYEVQSEQVGNTMVNAYAPGEYASENTLALRYATQALGVYTSRFGDYPFTELDVVGTPTLAGGVEYPGIVAISLSLYDPAKSFFEAATAHEVAHQWWYSVVGNDQIDEPWLDESLTQYATLQYWKDVYGQAAYLAAHRVMKGRWDQIDDADIPIGLPVAAYDLASYSGIIYGRGPLFFETLAQTMGEDTFDAFLRDYYQTFKWDIATTVEFEALAEQDCQCDLSTLFQTWVFPAQGQP